MNLNNSFIKLYIIQLINEYFNNIFFGDCDFSKVFIKVQINLILIVLILFTISQLGQVCTFYKFIIIDIIN